MTEIENKIFSLLKEIYEQKIKIEDGFINLIQIINELMVYNMPNNFRFDDYIISPNNEKQYKSKDGNLKNTTIFMNGNNVYRLIPKEDI